MKRVVYVTSGKGGVTKTKFARIVGEMHREAGTGAVLVDADASVGQFLKHLGSRDGQGKLLVPQPLEGVIALDWHNDVRGRDALADVLGHGRTVILDMPGGSLAGLLALDADAGYFEIVEAHGFEPTFVSMITPWVETWADAKQIRTRYPNAAQIIVVNHDFGDDRDFRKWSASETRRELLRSGSREVVLPALPSGIAADIAYHRLRFHDAPSSPEIDVMDRGRAKRWLDEALAAIVPVADVLGLPTANKSRTGAA